MPEILALPGIMPATAPIPVRDSLRPYQRHAVTAWRSDLETKRAALGVMFTGAGKTRTAGTFIHEWQRGRVLWLAMRDFLLDQAGAALGQITGEWIGREQAGVSSNGERIVVGSVQSLHRKRLALHPRDEFSLIAFDEAHHAVAPGPRAIFDHFETAKIIGLTATPYRLDKIGLDNVFGEAPSFVYDIEFGTEQGYFCPVVPIKRPIESIDLSAVRKQAGDLQLSQLEEQIVKATAPIADIAWEESEKGALSTLVYTPGVASAHSVCKAINEKAGKVVAVSVDADTDGWTRDRYLKAFGHTVRFIVNCQIYTEGLDVPLARCIVIARLTASLSLYQQMAGRGGRPAAGIGELETKEQRIEAIKASQKPWFKLVDITGKAGKHSLIGAVDALSGKAVSDDVKQIIDRIIEQSPGTKLDEATKLAKAEAAKKEAEEIRASEERIAKAAAAAEVRSKREEFDAFAKNDEAVSNDGIPPEWLSSLPTADQLLWLRDNKLSEEGVTRGHCAKLQKQAREWRKRGLCSFKRRAQLERFNLPVDVPEVVAKRLIDSIAQAGWKPWRAKKAIERILAEGRTVGEEG
jgi:superfamily II DNA or RNA helicase